MIEFITYTLIAWAANSCFIFLLYVSLSSGQWLNKLLKWDDKLEKWGMTGSPWYKIAGGCELCFCQFITQMLFWIYLLFIVNVCYYYPHAQIGWLSVVIYIVWYGVYVSIGSIAALKLLKSMMIKDA